MAPALPPAPPPAVAPTPPLPPDPPVDPTPPLPPDPPVETPPLPPDAAEPPLPPDALPEPPPLAPGPLGFPSSSEPQATAIERQATKQAAVPADRPPMTTSVYAGA